MRIPYQKIQKALFVHGLSPHFISFSWVIIQHRSQIRIRKQSPHHLCACQSMCSTPVLLIATLEMRERVRQELSENGGYIPKKWYQFSRLFTKDIPDIPKYRSSVWINPTALAPSSTQALPVRVKGSQTPTDRKRSPTHKDKAVISYSSSEQDMRVSKNGVVKYNLNRKILHRPLDVLFVSL